LPQIKAVITDYIGTLANARSYTMEASMAKLHSALADAGFKTEKGKFLEAYGRAHEKYRLVRFGELREVTNAVWVSETLCSLGYKVEVEDERLKSALDVFFEDYIGSLELRPYAEKLLKRIHETCKLGLVSNFTCAQVVHESMERLGITHYFNSIIVSQECGWRKPHRKIFTDSLEQLQVKAAEAVFIGDNPFEDIKGAVDAGMKTVFVCSQFYSKNDLKASAQKPDFVALDLEEIYRNLTEIISQIDK
jgi:putative hydrolase of the HAD superfamily